jgi:hypothetical protein
VITLGFVEDEQALLNLALHQDQDENYFHNSFGFGHQDLFISFILWSHFDLMLQFEIGIPINVEMV